MQHVPSKHVPAKHVLPKHVAVTHVLAIPVLEKLVHAKGTRPNKKQMWKKCACSQTVF